jgi:hypothetical protein
MRDSRIEVAVSRRAGRRPPGRSLRERGLGFARTLGNDLVVPAEIGVTAARRLAAERVRRVLVGRSRLLVPGSLGRIVAVGVARGGFGPGRGKLL